MERFCSLQGAILWLLRLQSNVHIRMRQKAIIFALRVLMKDATVDLVKLGGFYLVAASLSFFLCYEIGEAESPDYDSVEATQMFVIANAKVREVKAGVIVATVRAGWTDYAYVSPQKILIEKPLLEEMARDYEPPSRWRSFEWEKVSGLLGIAGVAKGGFIEVVKRLAKAPKRDWRATVTLAAGVLTGGIIGYYLGHSDKRDYNAKNFKVGITSKKTWELLIKTFGECSFKLKTFRDMANTPENGSDLSRLARIAGRSSYKDEFRRCTSSGQFIFEMPSAI